MKTKIVSLKIWKFILPLLFLCYISNTNAQCSPNVLTLYTQADVDNFGVTHGGVTDWDGSIVVGDYYTTSNITNLAGLSNLISICGTLTISYNPLLPNLIGLENLTELGSISIMSNTLLTNLEGLNSLNSVDEFLSISYNEMLVNLQGLENLNSLANFDIRNNNSLINLNGLSNLNLTGGLAIAENPLFTSLSGLNLQNSQLDGIYLYYNPMLENIDALQPLISVNKLEIAFNDNLDNLNGLSNLESVDFRFAVGGCPNITNVDALQNLTSVGIFTLQELNVSDLNGLVNLQSADELFLTGCYQLENLSGLENLISLKRLDLDSCPLLNSIEALSNVVFVDYDPVTNPNPSLYVYWNDLLSECAIAPICAKITDPNFDVAVEDNAIGCESIQAVIDECNLGVADESLNSIKLFPNPSNSVVNISSSDITQVKIFDMMGRKVLDAPIVNSSFNVETLAAGRYVAQLMGDGGEIVMENLIVK